MKPRFTETYKVYKDNNIVHLIIHEGSYLEYSEILEIDNYIKNNLSDRKYLNLLDARASFEIADKARSFFESPTVKKKMAALAVLISSNTKQQILDLFWEMNSRKLPVKLFVSYEEGVDWLNRYK